MKYEFVKEYEHFNLWLNTKNGCHECFWKNVNPNVKSIEKWKDDE